MIRITSGMDTWMMATWHHKRKENDMKKLWMMKRWPVALVLLLTVFATMAPAATTIVTRAGKGQVLTYSELDANFTNLKTTADAAQPSSSAWNDTKGPKSFAAAGYQKLPSGLIMQWDTFTAGTGWSSKAFPIPFPTACVSVTVTPSSDVTAIIAANPYNASTLQFRSSTGSINCFYIAIGY